MPAIILYPAIAGIVGYGLGVFSDSKKLITGAVIVGGSYYIYKKAGK